MINSREALIALRTGQKPAQRSGEYWSEEELQQIEYLYNEGVSISDIALQFDRTEVAAFQQLGKIGLLSRQCRPRTHKKKEEEPPEMEEECLCPYCNVKNCKNCGKERAHAGTV